MRRVIPPTAGSAEEKKEAALRYARLKVAFALAGRGSATAFAADCNVRLDRLLHCVGRHSKGPKGGVNRSWRLDRAADIFIAQTFAQHADTLRLDCSAEVSQ